MTTYNTQGSLQAKPDYAEPYLLDQNGNPFAVLRGRTLEDARRLAACWNACEGFTTEQLENILMLGDTLRARFKARNAEDAALSAEREQFRTLAKANADALGAALRQRDDLLEALQDALSVAQSVSISRDRRVVRDGCVLYLQTEEWCKWAEEEVAPRARAAIDKAKGT